jgi:hypothetical protein
MAHEVALDGLFAPLFLAFGAIAGPLTFLEPRHVAFADNTPMPVEASMAALDAEGVAVISSRILELGTTMTAVMP